MTADVFLDTAYTLVLSSPNDLFHQRAFHLADEVEVAGCYALGKDETAH